jgi:hypothetical protein
MNTLMVMGLGVLMGMQHATEADHLAAVATLTTGERSLGKGIRLGLAWGLGHTTTLLLIGGSVGLLGWVISPELAGRFEQVVGAMLIVLGLNLGLRLWRERYHVHSHTHGTSMAHVHIHHHAHDKAKACSTASTTAHATHASAHDHDHRLPARSIAVGMVHGLAGSAAMALLASQAMPSPAWGLVYIGLFGVGSIVGMALLSGAVAFSVNALPERLAGFHLALNGVAALASVLIGSRLLMSLA